MVNEDDIATATLSYAYSVEVKTDTFVTAVVSFEKADTGEEIGYHNIAYLSCDNPNISVTCESGALENRLYITASKTKTLVITLVSYKNGDFARTYGCENIGLFNLTDFNYTAKVGTKTLSADEIDVIQLLGTITFASGDAKQNEYGIQSFDLSSAYIKITVETDLKLTINKRQINLTLLDGENYNFLQ